jgi:hypothetical protein
MKKLALFCSIFLLFGSCGDGGALLPNVTGGVYDVLVVVNDNVWKSDGGKAVFDMLDADVPMLPQPEPMFNISHIPHSAFSNMLKPARNVILIYQDSTQYTKISLKYYRSKWAKSQAAVVITTPKSDLLADFIPKYSKQIIKFFVDAERERQLAYYKKNRNSKAAKQVLDDFGINITIASSIDKMKKGEKFLWISNGNYEASQNLLIYSIPYTSKELFTKEKLIEKRDSVLKANVQGSVKGSFMGTEIRFEPPLFTEFMMHDIYCAELRGLWKMYDGESMGGPFVSLTRLDEINGCLITVEGFVYAPARKKRNYIRQLEAMIYSSKMPQELNEVVVRSRK